MKVNNKILLEILRKFAKNKPTDKEQIIKKVEKLVDNAKRNRLHLNDHRLSKDKGSIVTLVSWEHYRR